MRNMNCVHRVWDDHVRNIEELYGVKVVFFNYFKHIRVVKDTSSERGAREGGESDERVDSHDHNFGRQ